MKHVVTLWLALFFGFAATLETLGKPGSFSFQEAKLKGIIRQVQSDGSKPPIAGALITLQGTAETGKASRTAVTDEEGRFTLFDLLPGDYVLTVEVAGFETYSKTYKIVSGAVSTVDIDLKIKATTDIVEVKSDPDEISKTESSSVGTLREKTLRNAPLVNEQFQDALPLLPGVVRGPDGLLNIKGARASQSGLLVNSSNVTDPVTGNFAISLPIEAIESVSVLSSPFSAEYGKFSGAVTSIGTRAGGDQWRFLFTNFFPRLRRRNDPVTGKSKLVGLESVTPRIILMGPLIKGKLTFSQSFQYQYIRTRVPSLPNLQNDTQLETFDSFTQVDWNVNARNHVTGVLSIYPQNLQAVNLNTFNPLEVSANFRQRGFFTSLAERTVFKNASLLETVFAFKRFNAFVFPNDNRPLTITPDVNQGSFFNRQDRYTDRYEGQAVYNLAPLQAKGNHQIKVGTNLSYTFFDGRDLNNPIRVANRKGETLYTIGFTGAGQLRRDVGEATVFVQDKYNPTPRLTLDLGLRYDRNGLSQENNFAPRFGFVAVPFSNGKTAIRGGIGVFYDKVPLGVGVFEQMQSRLPLGATVSGGGAANRIVQDVLTPYSIAGTVEVDHELFRRFYVRVGFQKREGRREFIVQPANFASGTVIPTEIQLSNGGRSGYREAQFTARYKFTDASDLVFSYVRSRTEGNLNDFNTYFGNFRTPIIQRDEISRLSFDAPNRFLVTGNLELPFGLVASPVLDVHTGFPYALVNQRQEFVGPRNPDNQRLPRFVSLDLQVTKKIVIPFRGKKLVTRIGVKMFNLTNHFNPRDVYSNIDAANFGVFNNSVSRTFRGKFEFDF